MEISTDEIKTKVCLMRDMRGSDLSVLTFLDMETAVNMFVTLSRIQKNSIQYVKSKSFYDEYLQEWSEYGNREELINIFTAIDGLDWQGFTWLM